MISAFPPEHYERLRCAGPNFGLRDRWLGPGKFDVEEAPYSVIRSGGTPLHVKNTSDEKYEGKPAGNSLDSEIEDS